jgi:hypothetical protein
MSTNLIKNITNYNTNATLSTLTTSVVSVANSLIAGERFLRSPAPIILETGGCVLNGKADGTAWELAIYMTYQSLTLP